MWAGSPGIARPRSGRPLLQRTVLPMVAAPCTHCVRPDRPGWPRPFPHLPLPQDWPAPGGPGAWPCLSQSPSLAASGCRTGAGPRGPTRGPSRGTKTRPGWPKYLKTPSLASLMLRPLGSCSSRTPLAGPRTPPHPTPPSPPCPLPTGLPEGDLSLTSPSPSTATSQPCLHPIKPSCAPARCLLGGSPTRPGLSGHSLGHMGPRWLSSAAGRPHSP